MDPISNVTKILVVGALLLVMWLLRSRRVKSRGVIEIPDAPSALGMTGSVLSGLGMTGSVLSGLGMTGSVLSGLGMTAKKPAAARVTFGSAQQAAPVMPSSAQPSVGHLQLDPIPPTTPRAYAVSHLYPGHQLHTQQGTWYLRALPLQSNENLKLTFEKMPFDTALTLLRTLHEPSRRQVLHRLPIMPAIKKRLEKALEI